VLVRPPLASVARSSPALGPGRGGHACKSFASLSSSARSGRESRSATTARALWPARMALTASTIGMATPRVRQDRQHRRGVRAFGHGAPVGHQIGGRGPSPSALPSEIAAGGGGTGQHQIAQPAQARQRLALGAQRLAEAQHLGIAARDQRGAGVLAEAEPFHHAAGDGEHVLDRAADLGAGHIVGNRGGRRGGRWRGRGVPTARARRRTPASRRSAGRRRLHARRSGRTARRWRCRRCLAGDIVHQPAGAGLDPLGAQHQIARGAGSPAQHAPSTCAGVTTSTVSIARNRPDRRWRGSWAQGWPMAGTAGCGSEC
jgi:hypothetical protein